MKKIILSSSSPYRQQSLRQLGLPFEVQVPAIDETPRPNEAPAHLVQRLAFEKAYRQAATQPKALWIGADQVIVLDTQILHKPKTHTNAIVQLSCCSGRVVQALTGLCVFHPESDTRLICLDETKATFRSLSVEEIERYLLLDKPYDCCGSIKVEGRGIALFEKIESQDPSALIGLPLIALSRFLRQLGVAIF